MVAALIALWDLAFPMESNRLHLLPSKLLNSPLLYT